MAALNTTWNPFNACGIHDHQVVKALCAKSAVYEWLLEKGIASISAEALTNNAYSYVSNHRENFVPVEFDPNDFESFFEEHLIEFLKSYIEADILAYTE